MEKTPTFEIETPIFKDSKHSLTNEIISAAFEEQAKISKMLDNIYDEVSQAAKDFYEKQLISDILNVNNGKWRTYDEYIEYKKQNNDPSVDALLYEFGLPGCEFVLTSKQFNYILYLKYTNNNKKE